MAGSEKLEIRYGSERYALAGNQTHCLQLPVLHICMTIRLTFLFLFLFLFPATVRQDALSTKKLCMLQSKAPMNSRVFNNSFVNLLFNEENGNKIFGGRASHATDSRSMPCMLCPMPSLHVQQRGHVGSESR